jgi:hypothetical protein
MKRANLIVVVRHYLVWDENGVVKKEPDGETGYTCHSFHMNFDGTVTFFSSGRPYTCPQDDVIRIEYSPNGATWCSECDQNIEQFSFAPVV